MQQVVTPTETSMYRRGLEGKLVLIGDTLELEGFDDIAKKLENLNIYDKRFLPISKSGDIVLVRKEGFSDDHLTYLNSIGFGTERENVIALNGDEKAIKDKNPMAQKILEEREVQQELEYRLKDKDYTLHSYHSSDDVARVAQMFGINYSGSSTAQSEHYNNKIKFKQFVQDLDIPVVQGTVIEKTDLEDIVSQMESGINEYGKNGRTYLRPEFGASGSMQGIVTKENIGRMAEAIMKSFSNNFLLEEHKDVARSPSVNYRITDGGIYRLNPVSGQILDKNNVHQGNFYPSNLKEETENKIIEYSEKIATEKQKQGYRGDDGYDYIVSPDGEVLPVENNARVTGAAPGAHVKSVMENRLNTPLYFATINAKSDMETFEELDKALGYDGEDILYREGRTSGVIPITSPSGGKIVLSVFAPYKEGFNDIGRITAKKMEDQVMMDYFLNS